MLSALAIEELLVVVSHAQAVELGRGLVVPLLDPGDQLEQTDEHRRESFGGPALAILSLEVER